MSRMITKKIALLSIMSSLSSFVYAGDMGGDCGDAGCTPTAFGVLEGGYTFNKINGVEVTTGTGTTATTTTLSAEKQQSQYTVRIAAGLINMIDDTFGFTGELGWGYYGSTTFNLPVVTLTASMPVNTTSKYTLYGLDALAGVAFVQPYYSASLKVGGLIQNMQINNTTSFIDLTSAAGTYTINKKSNSTAVLPAIKLGGAYNVDTNWAITASWLFAFGASTGTTYNFTPSQVTNFSVDVNTQNPMMHSLMLGVQYSI